MGKTFGEYVKEVCKLSNEDYVIAREIGLISDERYDRFFLDRQSHKRLNRYRCCK